MGKKGKSSSKAANTAPSKCTCDHPYKCDCGNRPERPSKGHKWDPETQCWGGKGHKQKGASGQTSSVATEAKTTAVGKTKIEQWQRMPSKLLDEVCQREGRPRAKYKSIGSSGKYKYRVIIQDAKASKRGTDHDLILVPASSCQNEEQAKEEAALLGLLQLAKNLPHERKLPEPYKTTWLNAVQASKSNNKQQKSTTKTEPQPKQAITKTSTTSNSNGSAASASSNLVNARTYVSKADKKRKDDEKLKARKERIRKHEAVRNANRDHQVHLSAKSRKRIESLLRGGSNIQQLLKEAEEDERTYDMEEEMLDDDLKVYVCNRLHHEGFTMAQARTAYSQKKSSNSFVTEDQWDNVYDECLQWLCIHLDEDELPEGFDPSEGMLDVVVAPTKTTKKTSNDSDKQTDQNEEKNKDERILNFSKKYGISYEEAIFVLKQKSGSSNEGSELNQSLALWHSLCDVSNTSLEGQEDMSTTDKDLNIEMTNDEMETLEAIFTSEECTIQKGNGDGLSIVRIKMPSEMETTAKSKEKLELVITFVSGLYPSSYPSSVLLEGNWTGQYHNLGAKVHLEIIKNLATIPCGGPMIYEIYSNVQTLLHSAFDGELSQLSLLPSNNDLKQNDNTNNKNKEIGSGEKLGKKFSKGTSHTRKLHRPRERTFFWSKKPKDSPPAIAKPNISNTLEMARKSLPAAKAREEFLSMMQKADKEGRVILVTGDTGCGKTTQIPQFILENAPRDSKIVVAQPRRLAATGVAARVANERGEDQPGKGSVGYIVRGEVAMCNNTRLVFCTTGVLLRQLQCDGALDSVTHIIVDEVHERHLDTDVLLGILKDCIKTTPHLRIILMSATLDADRFAGYWGKKTPRMHIPGRTFPVEDFFLEDVLALTGYIPPKKKGKKKKNTYYNGPKKSSPWNDSEKSDSEDEDIGGNGRSVVSGSSSSMPNPQRSNVPLEDLVERVDQSNVDYDMLGSLVRYLVETKKSDDDGSILVFLSGAPEINRASETIQKMTRQLPIKLLPLHGGLQPKDQNLVFKRADRGTTKVILSTNVAETSITIPDCTIVIDSCREKQSSYDPSNRMPLLLERFAAKDSLKQRRGRAGRVREGVSYKLICRNTLSKLPDHGEPEIRRAALDQTLLNLMFLGVERGSGDFLGKLLDPPSREAINSALFSLEKLGAITPAAADGTVSLTPLGQHLAGIPAPPTVGKILVMGSILGCRSAALAMAAGMSMGRSPFLKIDNFFANQHRRNREGDDEANNEESMKEMKNKKILEERAQLFHEVGNSDHAMLALIYMQWNNLNTGGGERKRFCDKFGLSFVGMKEMAQLARQLDSSLSSAGYNSSKQANCNARSWRIIKSCAVAALAPSQIVRVQRPATKYQETVEGAMEKDGEAKELKFFIRGEDNSISDNNNGNQQGAGGTRYRGYHGIAEERVFIHPSSFNFSIGSYSCPWLVYFNLVRTSKAFLRDATECSSYALLLFGGNIDVQASKGVIIIDEWARLAANARIGALIGGLREKVDNLLLKKVQEPELDIASTAEMKIIVSLLITDGLGG